MSINDLISATNGDRLNVDGDDAGQCTAVSHKWEQMLGLPLVYGDAYQIFDLAPDDRYLKVANAPNNFPPPGAIIVWNRNAGVHGLGPAGHVAVVISANPNGFVSLDQNWPTGSVVHEQQHDYAGVKGWIIPKVLIGQGAAAQPAPPQ